MKPCLPLPTGEQHGDAPSLCPGQGGQAAETSACPRQTAPEQAWGGGTAQADGSRGERHTASRETRGQATTRLPRKAARPLSTTELSQQRPPQTGR